MVCSRWRRTEHPAKTAKLLFSPDYKTGAGRDRQLLRANFQQKKI